MVGELRKERKRNVSFQEQRVTVKVTMIKVLFLAIDLDTSYSISSIIIKNE